MLGYKYNTEQEAQNAVLLCDNYYGYPNPDRLTQHACGYYYSEQDNFYYTYYDESLEVVLGTPVEFEITRPILEQ